MSAWGARRKGAALDAGEFARSECDRAIFGGRGADADQRHGVDWGVSMGRRIISKTGLVGGLAILMVAMLGVVPASAAAVPTVVAAPDRDLVDGQTITVSGSG